MSITGSLFRMVAPGLVDNLEAQGLFKGSSRVAPSLVPEMFIGREGISNLGAAGVIGDTSTVLKTLDEAKTARLLMDETDWNKTYGSQGIAFDDPAMQAMLEISDKNVSLKKGINLSTLPSGDYYEFDELVNAQTLTKAYPELSTVKVTFKDNPTRTAVAGYSPTNNLIEFNRKSPFWDSTDPVGTLLHEVQHYVQQRENFTQGESFSGTLKDNQVFQNTLGALQEKFKATTPAVLQFLKEKANKDRGFNVDNVVEALTALAPSKTSMLFADAETALASGFRSKEMAKKFINAVNEKKSDGSLKYPDLNDIVFLKDMNSAAYNTAAGDYMRVAGETFARETDKRRFLTAEERTQYPAMRSINEDKANRAYDITTQNLTAARPEQPTVTQAAMADPFQMQVPQSTIPGI
jgi:hypothetical protein